MSPDIFKDAGGSGSCLPDGMEQQLEFRQFLPSFFS
jgi:hypothetical protein